MGHKIGKAHHPRRGSLQFYPRVRARRHYPRIRRWPQIDEVRPLGFAGYKVGMAHVIVIDNRPNSPTKGQQITMPVTIIDCPKIKVGGIRVYKKAKDGTKKVMTEIWAENQDKDLKRKVKLNPKGAQDKMKKVEENLDNIIDVRLLCYTLPKGRAGKKKPEIFEIAIGGDIKKRWEYAKSVLGKELSVADVFQAGQQVDVIAVTKGKGFEGPIARFGAKLQKRWKTDAEYRWGGPKGGDVPRKVSWRVLMPGQHGYHTRTEYNKWILEIGNGLNPKSGWHKYGLVNDYIMLAGSVPGPRKRPIRLRFAIRPNSKIPAEAPKIVERVLG